MHRVVIVAGLLLGGCGQSDKADLPAQAEPPVQAPALSVARDDAAPSSAHHTATAVRGPVPPALPANGAASRATGRPAAELSPEKIADAWFEVLINKDLSALARLTAMPFTVHDRELKKDCGTRTARAPAELGTALDCILGNKLLADDLASPYNKPLRGAVLGKNDFPKWSKRWRAEIEAGQSAVGYGFVGAGVTHQMILLVAPDGVRAFWRAAEYDPT